MDLNPIAFLAQHIGTSEPALKLLLSILLSYPIAIYYNNNVKERSTKERNLFLTVCGLIIGFFNFGKDMYHSFIAVALMYGSMLYFGPGKVTTLITFVFNMSYLLLGYWFTESDEYDITWTMPHCVLVLKLIGLSFDLWDGTKPHEQLSASNKLTALRVNPSLAEIAGFIYFPASFLVGPQFSMSRYLSFINGKFNIANSNPTCLEAGLKRGLTGLLYLTIFQMGSLICPDDYLLSQEFDERSIIYKHIFLGFWGRFSLYKYISCWLLTEGLCITFGLAYNGVENEVTQWNGCCNVKLGIFEGATKFGHYIDSFNVNTNAWAAQYIYKRLIFLNNRYISQSLTLVFLAAWHGLHSGYYMTFLMEFVIVFMEKDIEVILRKNERISNFLASPLIKPILFTILKVYTVVFMGWCMVPFNLKTFGKWWRVYGSLFYSGFIFFFPWVFVYKPIITVSLRALKPPAVHHTHQD